MTTTLDDLPLPVPTHFRNGVLYAFSADQIRAARREGYELAMRKAQEGREQTTAQGKINAELGTDSNTSESQQRRHMAGSLEVGQLVGDRQDSRSGDIEPQGEKSLERWLYGIMKPIAEDIAKNCSTAPQLVIAPLIWGIEDLLKSGALFTSPPPKSDEPCGLFEVRVAGPDDVHSHDSEIEALRQANDINLQYVADCLKHPDSADHVMCVATVHKTDESKSAEPVASLTGPERVWTCTVIGKAEDLPRGSDAPMRKAVFDAFARQTGDAPAHIFSGWGSHVPERYRAVMENRLPDPEVIRKECLEVLNILPKSDELPTCTEERPCVNCFAGTTPCLGPHKRPPKSDEAMDAERWRMAIHTDNLTGCQYFSRFGALTPRLASDGVHIVGCKN